MKSSWAFHHASYCSIRLMLTAGKQALASMRQQLLATPTLVLRETMPGLVGANKVHNTDLRLKPLVGGRIAIAARQYLVSHWYGNHASKQLQLTSRWLSC